MVWRISAGGDSAPGKSACIEHLFLSEEAYTTWIDLHRVPAQPEGETHEEWSTHAETTAESPSTTTTSSVIVGAPSRTIPDSA